MPNQKQLIIGGAVLAVLAYFYWRSKQDPAPADGSSDTSGGSSGGLLDAITVTATRVGNILVSRGYRNNNPGNIRYIASNPWNGQIGNDNGYGIYDTPQNGVRALGHQLLAYSRRGLTTVRGIINVWAPTTENNTSAYVTDVCTQLSVGPDDQLDVTARLQDLCTAIARHENGYLDSSFDMSWCYL